MAVSTKKYAIALYETVKENHGTQLTAALNNFVKLLVLRRLASRTDRILNDFKKYYNEQEGIVAAELITSKELSVAEEQAFTHQLSVDLGKKVELTFRVDESLTGGAILRVGDYLIDGSLKCRLAGLKERIAGKS